jgi:hypothetical protein
MSHSGQKRKYSLGAIVFRFAPESGPPICSLMSTRPNVRFVHLAGSAGCQSGSDSLSPDEGANAPGPLRIGQLPTIFIVTTAERRRIKCANVAPPQ